MQQTLANKELPLKFRAWRVPETAAGMTFNKPMSDLSFVNSKRANYEQCLLNTNFIRLASKEKEAVH